MNITTKIRYYGICIAIEPTTAITIGSMIQCIYHHILYNIHGKEVVRLTESELNLIIKEATAKIMNEMDAATYTRIHDASYRDLQDIQNGNDERSANCNKKVDNDEIINKADELGPRVQAHWLKDYVGKTFKFFGRSQMGLPAALDARQK